MICEHCGHSMPDGSLTCEKCGTYLGKYGGSKLDTGIRSMRQGRVSSATPTLPPQKQTSQVREYGDYDLSSVPLEKGQPEAPRRSQRGSSRPDTRRGMPVSPQGRAPHLKHKSVRIKGMRTRSINWMRIGVILFVVLAAAGIGLMVYASRSENGQLATARRNALAASENLFALAMNTRDPLAQEEREALLKEWNSVSPQYYWQSGQYFLDMGDVRAAILAFRIGDVVDPDNYDGLLLLANAYELDAQDDLAEAVYLDLTQNVSPFRSDAYTALIRLYQAQGRRPEAAEMMRTAYNNTDREAFRLEREDYVPLMPQCSLNAGRYDISKLTEKVGLISPQGYDLYYTTHDDAVLPQDGILFTGGALEVEEGSVTLRAVCVSGDLVSDVMSVSYTFYYPSPPAPKCNLAPNTYKSLREVSLRPGDILDEKVTKAEKAEMEKHYVYHYTIDGSTPDENSPIYDGTPIKLPSGRVTIKAVCINQYGKMSSILEVGYKFDVKPYPLDVYQETDVFTGFVLNQTKPDEFKETFGNPKRELETTYLSTGNAAVHYEYDWGYAVFMLDGTQWELVRILMNQSLGNGPRAVGFGSTEAEITAVYKDFGQLPSVNTERGLYYDYPRVGKVRFDKDGTRMVEYMCQTAAGLNWILQYRLGADGRVNQIIHYYQP